MTEEMLDYLIAFVEVPHPAFGDLPVCPFVRQARVKNKIRYEVYEFGESSDPYLVKLLTEFAAQGQHEALWIINPNKDCKSSVAYMLADELQPLLMNLGLLAFGGGPDDPHTFKGVQTRREPYSNLVIQFQDLLSKARTTLDSTAYWDYPLV